jgi:hypothetical protein
MRCQALAAAILATVQSVRTLDAQAVRVSENVPVTVGLGGRPLFEPHLAIHPAKPNHLLGAAIVSVDTGTRLERLRAGTCATFLSLDGGREWRRHDFPITGCFDPWVVITPDGHALFSALGTHPVLPEQGRSGLMVFRSADGGRTWDQTPLGLGRGHDHPTMAVDWGASPRSGWVYLTSHPAWDLFIARSRNSGRTFDEPIRVVPNNLHNLAEMPVVLSDGTLIVAFVDVQRDAGQGGGRTGLLRNRRSWVVRSTDGGQTFSSPRFVSEVCGPIPEYRLAALSADLSSRPFRDRLYFACIRKGGGAIVLNFSADRGEIWSDPIPVHSAPADTTVLRQNPTLAVNKEGVLGVAWVDSRSAPGMRCFETYFAASLDGGQSFLPEQRVSSARSCPDSTAAWSMGGDYFGMVTTPDGQFHLLWSDARTGVFQLWTAAIKVDSSGAARE